MKKVLSTLFMSIVSILVLFTFEQTMGENMTFWVIGEDSSFSLYHLDDQLNTEFILKADYIMIIATSVIAIADGRTPDNAIIKARFIFSLERRGNVKCGNQCAGSTLIAAQEPDLHNLKKDMAFFKPCPLELGCRIDRIFSGAPTGQLAAQAPHSIHNSGSI